MVSMLESIRALGFIPGSVVRSVPHGSVHRPVAGVDGNYLQVQFVFDPSEAPYQPAFPLLAPLRRYYFRNVALPLILSFGAKGF